MCSGRDKAAEVVTSAPAEATLNSRSTQMLAVTRGVMMGVRITSAAGFSGLRWPAMGNWPPMPTDTLALTVTTPQNEASGPLKTCQADVIRRQRPLGQIDQRAGGEDCFD